MVELPLLLISSAIPIQVLLGFQLRVRQCRVFATAAAAARGVLLLELFPLVGVSRKCLCSRVQRGSVSVRRCCRMLCCSLIMD